MGCSTSVICTTCMTVFDCGCGSASSHNRRAELFPQQDHQGHDWFIWSSDEEWGTDEQGNLYQLGAHADKGLLVAQRFKDYKRLDLTAPTPLGTSPLDVPEF